MESDRSFPSPWILTASVCRVPLNWTPRCRVYPGGWVRIVSPTVWGPISTKRFLIEGLLFSLKIKYQIHVSPENTPHSTGSVFSMSVDTQTGISILFITEWIWKQVFIFTYLVWDRVSCSLVHQVGLILLLLIPDCWDHRQAPLSTAQFWKCFSSKIL